MIQEEKPIDFVIIWVDANDQIWQKKKNEYLKLETAAEIDDSPQRYRDWDNLKYWFRAVEKYAPWVRTVHFVTNGQFPEWLNIECQKLNLVAHEDYMPVDCLPVFNSGAIEVGLHRISGLSEQFVYFNDDMFLTDFVRPEDFFLDGIPVDMAGLTGKESGNTPTLRSWKLQYQIINKYFDRNEVIRKNIRGWLNPRYGKTFIRTLLHLRGKSFEGVVMPHLATPFLKSAIEEVWQVEHDSLCKTEHHRFRSEDDMTQVLFRVWRLCKGEFKPKRSAGRYYSVSNCKVAKEISHAIKVRKFPQICINDTWKGGNFEAAKQLINDALLKTLPDKCSFEI